MDQKLFVRMAYITEEMIEENLTSDVDDEMDILFSNSLCKTFNEFNLPEYTRMEIDQITLDLLLNARNSFEEGYPFDITDEPLYGFGVTEDLWVKIMDEVHGKNSDMLDAFSIAFDKICSPLRFNDDDVVLVIIEDHRIEES